MPGGIGFFKSMDALKAYLLIREKLVEITKSLFSQKFLPFNHFNLPKFKEKLQSTLKKKKKKKKGFIVLTLPTWTKMF